MKPFTPPSRLLAILSLLLILACGFQALTWACPFCSAVSQTLRQEMEVMDAVVIASATQGDAARNRTTGEVAMQIEKVLKGDQHVKVGEVISAVYYGEVAIGRRFMLSGVDPEDLQWSCLPVTPRGEIYVVKLAELAEEEPIDRLRFYDEYLQDDESMLARDAYDEFAVAPYDVIKKLRPEMDRKQLVDWIGEAEMSTDRKRLFLTMLGVCGDEQDLPWLEKRLRSTKKSTRGGLDALIACYLTLAGEKGLPLIDELFLENSSAPYADTYAAIMAVRFHGTEGDVIQRSALVESLHHVLNRKDLADLVIPDLARWQDWSQIDRLTELFLKSDPDNNWVRVPVVNYLRACPLDKAKEAIAKLEEADPESVRRANTFFSIPVPARETSPSEKDGAFLSQPTRHSTQISTPTSVQITAVASFPRNAKLALVPTPTQIASVQAPIAAGREFVANPLRLGFVIATAIGTFMIAPFLLLTGGPVPLLESSPHLDENS